MGDSVKLILISTLFIILSWYTVSTSLFTSLNFQVQAKKHPVRVLNSVNNSSSSSSGIIPGVGSSRNLASQEKHLIQAKLRQVLGEIIPHKYIVVLKDGLPGEPLSIAQEAISRGAHIQFVYNNAIRGFAIETPNKQVLNSILLNPEVDFVEPDIKVQAFSHVVSTGYARVGGPLSVLNSSHPQINVNAGIAIIDTGIDLSHPDLNVYRQVTFVPGTSTGNDDNGHGTAVAGIAAAKDTSVGVVGIAPGARLWAVKVLDSTGTGSMSAIIEGIDYVTQNAGQIDTANLSFGCKCNSSALDSAINNSVAAGVTYVVAAGNSGEDVSSWSPASNPNVISVAAIADSDGKCGGLGPPTSYGQDDSLASFSNFGSKVTIAAPGVNIYSTSIGSSYAALSGTSLAAPFVTGAAALYHSLHPGTSPIQVRNALVNLGSTASTVCDGDGHGYFANPRGSEPLLYIGGFSHG